MNYNLTRVISVDDQVDESGDYKGREDRDHRQAAEHDKQRVSWNIDRRCYMDAQAAQK